MEYVGSSNLSENEQEELVNLCNEFLQEVRTAIQIYLDLISGCQQNLDMANQTTDILEKIGQAIGEERLDELRTPVLQETGIDPSNVLFNLKDRNSSNGINYQFASRMTIVYIFEIWEGCYREEIKRKLKIGDNQKLVAPIMGDLRLLRNSIVHNKGKAKRDVSKCEIIRDFSEHDSIEITPTRMGFIKKQISLLIESLKSSIPVETVWRIG
jgi:hypothetical protein